MTTLTTDSAIDPAALKRSLSNLTKTLKGGTGVLLLGPEAITVTMIDANGAEREAAFYRLVAEQLLTEYDLATDALDTPDHNWYLHRACAMVMQIDDRPTPGALKRSVSTNIRDLSSKVRPSGALLALAQLNCFDLIVCLTPDNLLERALREAQPDLPISVTSNSPTLSSSEAQDVKPSAAVGLRLHHLLGRYTETSNEFAVHEEDALEYVLKLFDISGRGAQNLLTDLRAKDRIFLGVNLPDWLGRSLMRFVNNGRLSENERETREYISASLCDAALVGFVQRFSKATSLLPWTPAQFVAHMAETTKDLKPRIERGPQSWIGSAAAANGSEAVKIFISYASEDLAAAEQIASTLCKLGFDKVWFDKKALQPGDKWKQVIVAAINECDYFVPLLSKKTWDPDKDDREFRYEWRMGVKRDRHIGTQRPFLIPIDIEHSDKKTSPIDMPEVTYFDPEASQPNQLLPESMGVNKAFASSHIIHAKGGTLEVDGLVALQKRAQDIRVSRAGAARG